MQTAQKIPVLYYNNIYTPVNYSQSLTVDKYCNAVTFINLGLTVATINTIIPLNPGVPGSYNGESYTFGGNLGEIFFGRIDVSFAGGNGFVVMIQKIYIRDTVNKLDF